MKPFFFFARQSGGFRFAAPTLLVLAVLSFARPAAAWGPATQQAIATTAVQVVTKEGVASLSKIDKDVREGVKAPPEAAQAVYGGLAADTLRAIESEMTLLQAVRSDSVDPYYGFRLGMLAHIVADLASPLADEKPAERSRYDADVDQNIDQVALKLSPRRKVDPAAYFQMVRQSASTRKTLLLKEYQQGVGFAGVAKAALPEDVSRAIDAVADVWYTILSTKSVRASVSDAQLRDYIVNAFEYYIQRKNEGLIDATYRRLDSLTTKTPDLSKRIADMFYGAGLYDRAIGEYQQVLAAEPQRRDVVEKITAYYMKLGEEALTLKPDDTALDSKRLQFAYDAFAKAAKADPLHPTAEARRLETQKMMDERDARLEASRKGIEDAQQKQSQGEQFALQRRFADAISAFKEADATFRTVTDEFPHEYQIATSALSVISARIRELQRGLIDNAQALSGAQFLPDVQALAAAGAKDLDTRALRMLLANQLKTELESLKTSAKTKAAIR